MEVVNESKRLAEASGSFDRGIEAREQEEGSVLVMWRNLYAGGGREYIT